MSNDEAENEEFAEAIRQNARTRRAYRETFGEEAPISEAEALAHGMVGLDISRRNEQEEIEPGSRIVELESSDEEVD